VSENVHKNNGSKYLIYVIDCFTSQDAEERPSPSILTYVYELKVLNR
jgi:hypothetical protein